MMPTFKYRFMDHIRALKNKPTVRALIFKLEYIFITVDSTSFCGVNLQRIRLLGLPLIPAFVFFAAIIGQLVLYNNTLKGYQGMYNKAVFRYTVANLTTKLIKERAVFAEEFLKNKLGNFTLYNGSCVGNWSKIEKTINETNRVVDIFARLQWVPSTAEIAGSSRGSGIDANNSANFLIFLGLMRYHFNGKNLLECDIYFSKMMYVYGLINELIFSFTPNYYDVALSKTTFLHIYALQHMMVAHEQMSVLCYLAFEKFYLGTFVRDSTEMNFLANFSAGLSNLQNVKELHLESIFPYLNLLNNSLSIEFYSYVDMLMNSENVSVSVSFMHWFNVCSKFGEYLDMVKIEIVAGEKEEGFYPELNRCIAGIIIFSCAILILVPAFLLIYRNSETTIKNLLQFSTMFRSQVKNLLEQKEKNEQLLSEMLPTSVARELRFGFVPAESFLSATIYFSDIVDFNDIAMSCEPIEIVDLLNSVYNLLDSIIDCYDVYKVETIGSVYMVVSGVPTPNGQRHVLEVANMSLDILEKLDRFGSTRFKTKVELKIGINTGPCVAGIVGNKMPRYCLFGDSINTASRMQSTGAASHIHLSQSTYLELKNHKKYNLIQRGVVDVKGKGKMLTYWLLGRDCKMNQTLEC